MRNKTHLAIGVISFLVLLLIFLNFILPKISLPNFQRDNDKVTNSDKRPAPTIKEIELSEGGFSPNSITIKIGEVVIFKNTTEKLASINSNPHPTHNLYRVLNLGEFGPNTAVQVMLDKPGTYSYHNHLVPTQQGTIVVEE